MISVQPIHIKQYIAQDRKQYTKSLPYKFYISWEDALWDIINSFGIPKGSKILVPSFFCTDVMNNMKDHGLSPLYYKVDENLQPDPQEVRKLVKTYNPSFLVLFHAVGIQNDCMNSQFINTLPSELIIIEDGVHRIVNPSEVKLYAPHHIVINSFRKVVPLQGSFLFGQAAFINKLKGAATSTFFYSWSIIFFWWLMQIFFTLQKYTPVLPISLLLGRLGEICMLRRYDIIGDEKAAGFCPAFFKKMYFRLDFKRIKEHKRKQVLEYETYLNSSAVYRVPGYSHDDRGELRGYPIIAKRDMAKAIISFCREHGLLIRAELDDSKWAKKRSIMYLPLGPHVEIEDIKIISTIFNRAVSSVHNTSP